MKKFPLLSQMRRIVSVFVFCVLSASLLVPAEAQNDIGFERGRGRDMLKTVKEDIKKNYYDTSFHGIDLDARFKAADEKIQQAQSVGQIFGIIAQVLLDFDDSHLFFVPPGFSDSVEYGWQMQAIGDKTYVISVKPGSNAEAQGLKPGDLVLNVGGFKPTRELAWKINYLFYSLRPSPVLPVTIQTPKGEQRQLQIQAQIKRGTRRLGMSDLDYAEAVRESVNDARLNRHRYVELGDEAFIWKMPSFNMLDSAVDELMGKAKKHKALILDMRGNGGGAETALKRLASYFIEGEVKIGDLKGRKEMKPMTTKGRGGDAYKGKLVILLDSQSGSAAEVFARLMQLEKRGTVIGDRSAGAVMRSQAYDHLVGSGGAVYFYVSVTDADLVMTDGKSLEHVGVMPDELLLPAAADLAANRDPVLTRAAELAGIKLPAEKAGAMFPIEWKK